MPLVGAACELGSAAFSVTLLDVQPNAEFNLNTGYGTLNLLLATDTPASLYDAGVLIASRLNAAPELAGQFVASVFVSGPTVQVVVTYTLAGANALIQGAETCGAAFDDTTGESVEWSSPFGVTFAVPYPKPNSTAASNSRFLCCPVPCAPDGMESYGEIRVFVECLGEGENQLFIAPVGLCPPPSGPVLTCGDFTPLSGAGLAAGVDAIVAGLQVSFPTWVITREGLDVIVLRIPISDESECTASYEACHSGEIVAHVIQQPACCQPVEPCAPGLVEVPEESQSAVFTNGDVAGYDCAVVFYADCCAPVDAVASLSDEAAGVTLTGTANVLPLGGNKYAVVQTVDYDGTPASGDPGEQINAGTVTFNISCGGASDSAFAYAVIIGEPEDPTPTCPLSVIQATTGTVTRQELAPAVTHGIGTRIQSCGTGCVTPTVTSTVLYEDIASRLTINPIPVVLTTVAGTEWYIVVNVNFNSAPATAVPGPYPKLVGTVEVEIACGDSTITRTVDFYLLSPL